MKNKLPRINKSTFRSLLYGEYKFMIRTGAIALVFIGVVLIVVKDEIDRFTFIMPIFAAWILACILFDLPEETEVKDK